MNELLLEFKDETKKLIDELESIVNKLDEDPSNSKLFGQFAQIIDRVMGGAKSLALALPQNAKVLNTIGDYAEVCKAVGYKMSQTKNPALGVIVIAFFSDAIESLLELLGAFAIDMSSLQQKNDHLLERLKWLAQQFDPNLRASITSESKLNSTKQLQNLIFQFQKSSSGAKT